MEGWEEIYTQYYQMVYNYCLYLCHNAHQAEEIAQEAFFRALKSISKYQGKCRIEVWICQIAKNLCFSAAKKKKCGSFPPHPDWEDSHRLEDRFEDQESALEVHRALHKLEEPYREVFWLRVFGELSFAQIATLFQKTESWARVTYHRARLKIKEELP